MKAEIIAIGSEILLGDIVNTNAQYLARELANLGIDVYHQQVVGDNEERLLRAYDEAYKRSDLIITTGGLGPTQDDITKESAAKYFNKKLKLDEDTLKSIEKYFNKQGRELKGNNVKQAYFPEGAIIMPNSCGTASGVIIEEENKKMIILPGPPKEMESMFNEQALPYLEKLTDCVIRSKMLRIFGIGESFMAEELAYLIDNGKNPTVAPKIIKKYNNLNLFSRKHCMDESVDMEGKVIVLNHMSMKEEYWKPEYQLCLATGGFGCRPPASGRAVYATCLYDGDKARWNRENVLGVLKDEYLPDWAREKLEKLQNNEPEEEQTGGISLN